MTDVPAVRVHRANDRPIRPDGDFVLYWMVGSRRLRWSFAVQHAQTQADRLGLPLLVLEPLRADYPWASDRFHRFVIEGMQDNAATCAEAGVRYYPYVEPAPGAGRGLLAALAARAALVVTDETPGFFLPRMVAAVAGRVDVRLETVDGIGILPLRAAGRAFTTAASFRRHLQKTLSEHLRVAPVPEPLASGRPRAPIPPHAAERWPAADPTALLAPAGLAALPIDHVVGPVAYRGGSASAEAVLAGFLADGLARYATDRNDVARPAASGLSPWLHFGHLSAHQVVHAVLDACAWTPLGLAPRATGSRAGWWGAPAPVESFLDQMITWRELGQVFCFYRPGDYDRLSSLPDWAQATLWQHAADPRPVVYSLDALDAAATHDPLWNAAQRQLRQAGHIHNYLRMLWGKKILEWTPDPQEALRCLVELNNRYAVDGRDPNSWSGILWTLGRFDRAWGPERPIFGKVRFMSSASTARKLDVRTYLQRWGP